MSNCAHSSMSTTPTTARSLMSPGRLTSARSRASTGCATSRGTGSSAGISRNRRSRPQRRPGTSTRGSTTWQRSGSTTTSSSSSTSIIVRARTTSIACSGTSSIRRLPGSRHRACAGTSTTGRHEGWPSRTWSFRGRCRWASTAPPAPLSSSARTRHIARRRSARSVASSRHGPRIISTRWCSPRTATPASSSPT